MGLLPHPSTRLPLACLGVLLLAGVAGGETFEFRDGRPPVRGRVLVEFDHLLFVSLDRVGVGFLARAELAGVVDREGRRLETPAPGAFAPLRAGAPAAAVTHVAGEVVLRGAEDQPIGPAAMPVFLQAGGRLATGEAGLARLVTPAGGVLKLGTESEVGCSSERARDTLQLLRGEGLIESGLRPLAVLGPRGLAVTLGPSGVLGLLVEGTNAQLVQHRGSSAVAWGNNRVTLRGGQGLEVSALGAGRSRVRAEETNAGPVAVQAGPDRRELEPGDALALGGEGGGGSKSGPWRLVQADGEVFARRGESPFAPVTPKQRGRLLLGRGDALKLGVRGQAALSREDGAALTLSEPAALLELGRAPGPEEPAARRFELLLRRGVLDCEALHGPLRLETPGGMTALRLSSVRLTQVEGAPELQVACQLGTPQLALGEGASLSMQPGSQAELVTRGGTTWAALTRGRATARSHPVGEDASDPEFSVALAPGDRLGVRAPDAAEGRGGLLRRLVLPGGREFGFHDGALARLELSPEVLVRYPEGATVRSREGLTLALARDAGRPQLRFRSGPRLRLDAPLQVTVENPTAIVAHPAGDATLILEGDVDVRLQSGGNHAAAAVGAREDDHVEVTPGGSLQVDASPGLLRFAWGDGRRLWIQDGAPPVQARLANAEGGLYLTMPGTAALGLTADKPLTVLATSDGEFVVLSADGLELEELSLPELELLVSDATGEPVDALERQPIPELLDVPREDSPSGP